MFISDYVLYLQSLTPTDSLVTTFPSLTHGYEGQCASPRDRKSTHVINYQCGRKETARKRGVMIELNEMNGLDNGSYYRVQTGPLENNMHRIMW